MGRKMNMRTRDIFHKTVAERRHDCAWPECGFPDGEIKKGEEQIKYHPLYHTCPNTMHTECFRYLLEREFQDNNLGKLRFFS